MPLSEHEQRLLEQMERALYAEDPKFATALEGAGMRTHTRRRTGWAIAGFVVGLVLLMTGVMLPAIWISVVGFLLMLTGAVLAVTGWRRSPAQAADAGQRQGGRAPRPRRAKMMNRIEDRWRRRRDEQG
ncbi:DUF3040 domain-containing protein [Yinghuangia seranimata]|uniref:DUF3040 domain-containing protein n=1 Tax=Yinghuangia seranimata TaxID=408067 RepID=UPI00248A8F87|nr:DUF3040 domain-containing protein [Yinghuangia seranimata]MDI2126175.1 DUF3040 domain-containing protein [Yinghuangia seranimata]